MLYPVTLPISSGSLETVTLNVGNMTNKGVEMTLGYNDRFGDFNFGASATFSKNVNEITSLNSGLDGLVMSPDGVLVWGSNDFSKCTAMTPGFPAGAFFLYRTNGIADTPGKLAEYQVLDPSAKMGDLMYVDTDGNSQITEADRDYCGGGLPDYELGFNLNAEWKGIDFSMNWYASVGHEIMNGAKAMAFSYGRHKDLVYAWSEQNQQTSIPAYRGNMKIDRNYRADTDLWLEDGTYLRLKNITLGYTFPVRWTGKIGISSLRLYVSAQNPLTFTNYEGYDPEIGGSITSRGLDRGNYPVSSFYMGGININF